MGRDIVVATGWTVRESNTDEGENLRPSPDGTWGPPSLLYNRSRFSFLGVKRPGLGVDHPPPSRAEVKGVELYLYSPLRLHGLLQGERCLYSLS